MSLKTLRRLERRFVRGYLRRGRQKRPSSSVNVEPTNMCNLSCNICPHGAVRRGLIPPPKREKGFMRLDTFRNLVQGCDSHIKTMALYLHGEPFLHRELDRMIALARERKIAVNLFSNGLALGMLDSLERVLQEQPRSLCLSMDLISKRGYALLRGADIFDEAQNQLLLMARIFTRRDVKTKLVLRSIYTGESREELQRYLHRFLSLDGLHSVQITHAFPWPGRKDADVLGSRLARKRDAVCPQVWNAMNVYWDGTVVPCSFDYDAQYPVGNVNDAPLDEIANSPQARRFRRMHIFGRSQDISLCRDCLLPRFLTNIIVVRKKSYAKMTQEQKEQMLRGIMNLRFDPAKDFSSSEQTVSQEAGLA